MMSAVSSLFLDRNEGHAMQSDKTSCAPWCHSCVLHLSEHQLTLDINTQVLISWHYCIIDMWFITAPYRQAFVHHGRGGESISLVNILSSFIFTCHRAHIIMFGIKILLSGGLIFLLKWRDFFFLRVSKSVIKHLFQASRTDLRKLSFLQIHTGSPSISKECLVFTLLRFVSTNSPERHHLSMSTQWRVIEWHPNKQQQS